jgi:hypothetical protein
MQNMMGQHCPNLAILNGYHPDRAAPGFISQVSHFEARFFNTFSLPI